MKPASTAQATAEPLAGMNPTGAEASNASDATTLEPTDADLVQRIQDGDPRAFRALFDRYHRRAFAVAVGVVKNQQDAMDVVQDAFIKVHRHIGNFQGNSSFYTWLYRIVMNLAIDHVRKGRTMAKADFDDRLAQDGRSEAPGMGLPQRHDDHPGLTASRRELADQLNRALAVLPEHHQAVIVLREVEGMSYEDMAQVLDVPKGTIMSRLFHARKKMQEALHGYLQGDLEVED